MQDVLPWILWKPILDRALELRFYPNLWDSYNPSRIIWIPWDVPHYMRSARGDMFQFYAPNHEVYTMIDRCTFVPAQRLDTLQSQLISRMAKDSSMVSDEMLWDAAPRHVWIMPWKAVIPTLYDAATCIWSFVFQPILSDISKPSMSYTIIICGHPVASLSLDDKDAVHIIADYLYKHFSDASFSYILRDDHGMAIEWRGAVLRREVSRTPCRHPFNIPPHLKEPLMDYFLNTRFWDFMYYADQGNAVVWVPDERVFVHGSMEMRDYMTCTTEPCRWDSHMLHCNAKVKHGCRLLRLQRRSLVDEKPGDTLQRRIMRYLTHTVPLTWFWSHVPKHVYVVCKWIACSSSHEVANALWQIRENTSGMSLSRPCVYGKMTDQLSVSSEATQFHLRIDGMSVDTDLQTISEHIQYYCAEKMECQWGISMADSDEIVYGKPIIVEHLSVYHPPAHGNVSS